MWHTYKRMLNNKKCNVLGLQCYPLNKKIYKTQHYLFDVFFHRSVQLALKKNKALKGQNLEMRILL